MGMDDMLSVECRPYPPDGKPVSKHRAKKFEQIALLQALATILIRLAVEFLPIWQVYVLVVDPDVGGFQNPHV
jgi:hypothetical protein